MKVKITKEEKGPSSVAALLHCYCQPHQEFFQTHLAGGSQTFFTIQTSTKNDNILTFIVEVVVLFELQLKYAF